LPGFFIHLIKFYVARQLMSSCPRLIDLIE
jgi:hypothetical protein